jgi:hypothetical protein
MALGLDRLRERLSWGAPHPLTPFIHTHTHTHREREREREGEGERETEKGHGKLIPTQKRRDSRSS